MDDRLPCLAGRLCFSRCQRADVFWLPLLEKVYAKCAHWVWRGAGGPTSLLSLGRSTFVSSKGLVARRGVGLTAQRQEPWDTACGGLSPAHFLFPCLHSSISIKAPPPERGGLWLPLSLSSDTSKKDVSICLFLTTGG